MWHLNQDINKIYKINKTHNFCIYKTCFNGYLKNVSYNINTLDIDCFNYDDTYSDINQLKKYKYLFIYDTKNIKFIEYIFFNSILLDVIPIFINKHNECILNYYKYNIDKLNICLLKSLPDNINDIHKLYPYIQTVEKQQTLKKNIIQKHIIDSQSDINEGITFTITTCKRYNKFVETMDTFLNNCIDHNIIKHWICIDDNSSPEDRNKMKKKYPFLEFILKKPENKGHAKSLNLLWDEVKTPFIFQMEDDWIIYDKFSLVEIINNFKSYNLTQIIVGHCHGNGEKLQSNINLLKYCANINTSIMPFDIIQYKHANNTKLIESFDNFWWPGFTLHPSIIYVKKLKNDIRFSEIINNNLFEYDFSLKAYNNMHKIAYCGYNVGHIGDVSSYDLNNEKR